MKKTYKEMTKDELIEAIEYKEYELNEHCKKWWAVFGLMALAVDKVEDMGEMELEGLVVGALTIADKMTEV